MRYEKTKEEYYQAAARLLVDAEQVARDSDGDIRSEKAFLTRGVYQLASGQFDEALSSFDGVLAEKRTNIVALAGKARIQFHRRQYPQALKTFQQILQLAPNSQPDPRIGIGLCFWALDQKDKARRAWERSLEVVRTAVSTVWCATRADVWRKESRQLDFFASVGPRCY